MDVVNMFFFWWQRGRSEYFTNYRSTGIFTTISSENRPKKRKYPVAVVWRNLVIVSVQRRMNRLVENENGEWK